MIKGACPLMNFRRCWSVGAGTNLLKISDGIRDILICLKLVSPLTKALDAITVDVSELTLEEVYSILKGRVMTILER